MTTELISLSLRKLDSGYIITGITEEFGREKSLEKAFSTLPELIKYIQENF